MFHQARLATLIAERAFQYGEFTLASGQKSNFYLDLSKVTLDPEGLTLICKCFWEKLYDNQIQIDAISGPSAGADPIIGAMTAQAYLLGRDVKGLMVRSKPKDHGDKGLIEGPVVPGMRVAVVDDVVTTGGSLCKAIDALVEAGCQPACVLSVVDRGDANFGVRYFSLFKLSDLAISRKILEKVTTPYVSPCSSRS
jgi:orotate phosphoribosyltransferase